MAKEVRSADEQRPDSQLDEESKSGDDLAIGSRSQDTQLEPLRERRFLHRSDVVALCTWKVRVHEVSERFGLGNQLGDQLDSLAPQLGSHKCHAREVAARTGETGD